MAKSIIDTVKELYPSGDFLFIEKGNVLRIEVPKKESNSVKRIEIGKKLIYKLASMKNVEVAIPAKDDGYKEFAIKENGTKKKIQIKPQGSEQSPFVPAKIAVNGKTVVDDWINVSEFITISLQYVKTLNIPEKDKKDIIDMIKECTTSNPSIPFNGNKKLVPSEFYEILSAIKLAVLIGLGDKKIWKIVGLPDKTKIKDIEIFIPKISNYPLIDYEISINGAHKVSSSKDERPTLKISVKSKVSSAKSNTVKFSDVFANELEVKKWMKQYGSAQQVQGTIAESGVSYPSGKKLYFTVDALGKVIDKIRGNLDNVTVQAIKKIADRVYSVQKTDAVIDPKHFGLSQKEFEAAVNFVHTYVKKKNGAVAVNMINFLVACEKFFEKESQKMQNNKNLNFYQMFYDNILKSKKVAYSVSKVSGKNITFNYYTLINWAQEYDDWIALRTKNFADNLNDTMGLDV